LAIWTLVAGDSKGCRYEKFILVLEVNCIASTMTTSEITNLYHRA